MNNDTSSVPIRKATTAEFIDANKFSHKMKKALMATDGQKGKVSFAEEPKKEVKKEVKEKVVSLPPPAKARRHRHPEGEEPPMRHKVASFVEQHLS